MVYAGDIEAGYCKLITHVSQRQPKLKALLDEARYLGIRARLGTAHGVLEAI